MSKKNRNERQGNIGSGSNPMFAQFYEPLLNPQQRSRSRTQSIGWMLERKLMSICMARFEWQNLPPEISKRNLEMSILQNCLSFFFQDDTILKGKYMAMYAAPSGNINMLGDPTQFVVYGNGLYPTRTLTVDQGVPIWGNYMRIPDLDVIRIYATKLSELDRTIEINAKNARQNKFIIAEQTTGLTMANINREMDAGNNGITVDAGFADIEEKVKVLDLGIDPDAIVNLSMLRGRLWNELMTLLGINNANQDKKERLVAAEVSGNDDMVEVIRNENLNARQDACDLINDMYGLDVWVEYKTSVDSEAQVDTGTPNGGPVKLTATPARREPKAIEGKK